METNSSLILVTNLQQLEYEYTWNIDILMMLMQAALV